MNRVFKQLIYFLFFLAIIILVIWGLRVLIKVEPTCFDGIQNQMEEGIDCGGPCEKICLESLAPLNVISSKLIQIKEGDYDFLAKVSNTNPTHGSGKVKYDVVLKDDAGSIVKTVGGEFSILPGQTRYVLVSPIQLDGIAVSAELIIKEPNWVQLTDFNVGDIKFTDRKKEYIEIKDTIFSKVEGIVFNDSDFDFDRVEILVILYDSGGEVIAVGATNVRTFANNTESFFEVNWFDPFRGAVSRIDIQTTTNVFENLNFLRTYGEDEQFQRF